MSTTTIRLPEELRARVASAAERAGKTTDSFILEAIAEKIEQEEFRSSFEAEADERFEEILKTGETIPWDEARAYLEGRAAGKQPLRPQVKKKS